LLKISGKISIIPLKQSSPIIKDQIREFAASQQLKTRRDIPFFGRPVQKKYFSILNAESPLRKWGEVLAMLIVEQARAADD
jgi:hypothetical protein